MSTREDIPGLLFDGPVFLTGHPVEVSPFCKEGSSDPRITAGSKPTSTDGSYQMLLSELNDPIDQYEVR